MGASTISNAHFSMPQGLRSVWPPTHVTFALLGCALFVLAAVVSLAYLVYERRLKAKRSTRETRQSCGPR
jgi:ABC-type transport system involved in cytochrome c biogenesis permease subunit